MRGELAIIMVTALVPPSSGACAMKTTEPIESRCLVSGAEKLPAQAGGIDGLCEAISRAANSRAPGVDYRVEVRVTGPSMLDATLTLPDGRRLPTLSLAVSDAHLSPAILERFAADLMTQLTNAMRGPGLRS